MEASCERLPAAGAGHPLVRRLLDTRRGRGGHAVALDGLWAIEAAVAAGVPVDVAFVCPSLVRGPDGATLVAPPPSFSTRRCTRSSASDLQAASAARSCSTRSGTIDQLTHRPSFSPVIRPASASTLV